MKVNDLQSVVQGLDPRVLRRPDKPPDKPAPASLESADGDSLDVNLATHVSERAAMNATDSSQDTSTLDPSRVAEIRDRIQSGFYNSPSVLADSVDRMLSFYSR